MRVIGTMIKVYPGELYVTDEPQTIVTVLGSCVSACMHDPVAGIAGMNHFMLPAGSDCDPERAMRYGAYAMDMLVGAMLKNGALRNRIDVKLFGGGSVLKGINQPIGRRNAEFARSFVRAEGLRLVAEDLLGDAPRKIMFDSSSGTVFVKILSESSNDTIAARDRDLLVQLERRPASGSTVEWFQ